MAVETTGRAASETLARYREMFKAEEQATAEREERERQEAQATRLAERQEALKSIAKNVRSVLGSAIAGWMFEAPENTNDSSRLYLVPDFAPEIKISAEWVVAGRTTLPMNGYPSPHVRLNYGGPGGYRVLPPTATLGACEEALMRIVVPMVEQMETRRRRDEEQLQRDTMQAERTARAEARLAELVAEAKVWGADTERDLLTRYGWPKGQELTVYRLEWMMGLDGDGNPVQWTEYSLDRTPFPDGTYSTITREGIARKTILTTQGAIVSTEVVWRSTADLLLAPQSLTDDIGIYRRVLVATSVYKNYYDQETLDGPTREVAKTIRVPCATIRRLLGISTDKVEHVRDEVVEDQREPAESTES